MKVLFFDSEGNTVFVLQTKDEDYVSKRELHILCNNIASMFNFIDNNGDEVEVDYIIQ